MINTLVVVVEHDVFSLVARDVGDALKVALVLGDEKRARLDF